MTPKKIKLLRTINANRNEPLCTVFRRIKISISGGYLMIDYLISKGLVTIYPEKHGNIPIITNKGTKLIKKLNGK